MAAKQRVFSGRITCGDYKVSACRSGHVHLDLKQGADTTVDVVFANSNEAYEFAQAILRGYDMVEGLLAPHA